MIAANIAWNAANARCGTVAAYAALGSAPTPVRPHQLSPPTNDVPGPKASEYPATTHCTLTMASAARLIIKVLSAFF